MKINVPLAYLHWTFLGLVLTSVLSQRAGGAAADPSLLMHLDFDEDFTNGKVEDVTGNGHDGWNMQGTNWISATNGTFGTTAGFWYTNGVTPINEPLSTYLAITNVDGLTNLSAMTLSVWTKTDPTAQDIAMEVVSSGYDVAYSGNATACSNSWDLRRYFSPNMIFRLYPSDGDRNLLSFPNDVVSAGGTYDLTQTTWHHYAATLDCIANIAIGYHDGIPFQTNTLNVPYVTIYGGPSMRWICIGADAHSGVPQWGTLYTPNDGYFAGRMDDLRIYNRALSVAEVQALYQGSLYAQNVYIQTPAPSTVQLCWPTKSNTTYQIEFEPSFSSDFWTSLGPPIYGNGQTNCVTDSLNLALPSRFYRVRILPY